MNVPCKRVHLLDSVPDNDPDCSLDCDPDTLSSCTRSIRTIGNDVICAKLID